jgi:hypothetical protein
MGETHSNYFVANAGSKERIPRISVIFPTLSVEDAAGAVVKCIASGKPVFVYPRLLSIVTKFHEKAPTVVQCLVNATGWKYEVKAKI